MRARALLPALLVALAALTALPSTTQAQEVPSYSYDYEDPTDWSYSYWNLFRWGCPRVEGAIDGQFIHEDCWGDPTMEDAQRGQAKGLDRWLRAGLLTIKQLGMVVEAGKEVIQGTKATVDRIQAVIAGVDEEDPLNTIWELRWATDRFSHRLDQAEHLASNYSIPLPSKRYTRVDLMVERFLAGAEQGERTATTLVRQANAGKMRVGKGEPQLVTFGGPGYTQGGHPPMPFESADTPPSPGLYADGRAVAPPSADPLEEGELCGLPEGGGETPQVMYQRAIVQAKGAQTATVSTNYDLQRLHMLLTSLRVRENSQDRQIQYSAAAKAAAGH